MDHGGVADRNLTRSRANRRIAGVCGGIAEYFGIDPIIPRIGFVAAALMGLSGLFVYIVLWIVLPEAPPGEVGPASPSAVRIAEERYARGEITSEELATIRRDLTAAP
jgi:phage shock protein C